MLNRGYDRENEETLAVVMEQNHALVLNLIVSHVGVLNDRTMADVASAIGGTGGTHPPKRWTR